MIVLEIQKKYISQNFSKGVTITPAYVVIHETANTGKGANALAHYTYWNNAYRGSSAHYVVDDKSIIQLLPDYAKAWHVGDNKGHSLITNSNSIGIEICINSDGDYDKAVQNAQDLATYLLKKYNLPIDRLKTHNDASGKNCPTILLKTGRWSDFKSKVQALLAPAPTELTAVNDIVWELGHRGIILDKTLWLKKLEEDSNSYWLARKCLNYIRNHE